MKRNYAVVKFRGSQLIVFKEKPQINFDFRQKRPRKANRERERERNKTKAIIKVTGASEYLISDLKIRARGL